MSNRGRNADESSWRRKAYERHRFRVKSARATVDVNPPEYRPHVAFNAKRVQLERERQAGIARNNFILLKKLREIMNRKSRRVAEDTQRIRWQESRCVRTLLKTIIDIHIDTRIKPTRVYILNNLALRCAELKRVKMQELVDVENHNEARKEFDKEEERDEEVQQPGHEEDTRISLDGGESWSESRALTRSEAGECLNTLGKCVESYEHAYLGLDASDRNLTDVSVISSFEHVRYVNVSGNRLTSEALRAFETMPYLQILQADRNLLTAVDLKPMPYLQQLILNKNKITDTSGIRHKQLERLELNYNNLRSVTLDPEALVNLKTLELRGNALDSTKGICCPSLVHLFLAENRIERIEDLELLVNLETLHLRSNELTSLDGFTEECRSLSYVNLRNNKLARISELSKLGCLPNLEILIVLENPFLRTDEEGEEEEEKEERQRKYRLIILAMLPKLKRIDKDSVSYHERNEAKELLRKMTKEDFEDFDLQN